MLILLISLSALIVLITFFGIAIYKNKSISKFVVKSAKNNTTSVILLILILSITATFTTTAFMTTGTMRNSHKEKVVDGQSWQIQFQDASYQNLDATYYTASLFEESSDEINLPQWRYVFSGFNHDLPIYYYSDVYENNELSSVIKDTYNDLTHPQNNIGYYDFDNIFTDISFNKNMTWSHYIYSGYEYISDPINDSVLANGQMASEYFLNQWVKYYFYFFGNLGQYFLAKVLYDINNNLEYFFFAPEVNKYIGEGIDYDDVSMYFEFENSLTWTIDPKNQANDQTGFAFQFIPILTDTNDKYVDLEPNLNEIDFNEGDQILQTNIVNNGNVKQINVDVIVQDSFLTKSGLNIGDKLPVETNLLVDSEIAIWINKILLEFNQVELINDQAYQLLRFDEVSNTTFEINFVIDGTAELTQYEYMNFDTNDGYGTDLSKQSIILIPQKALSFLILVHNCIWKYYQFYDVTYKTCIDPSADVEYLTFYTLEKKKCRDDPEFSSANSVASVGKYSDELNRFAQHPNVAYHGYSYVSFKEVNQIRNDNGWTNHEYEAKNKDDILTRAMSISYLITTFAVDDCGFYLPPYNRELSILPENGYHSAASSNPYYELNTPVDTCTNSYVDVAGEKKLKEADVIETSDASNSDRDLSNNVGQTLDWQSGIYFKSLEDAKSEELNNYYISNLLFANSIFDEGNNVRTTFTPFRMDGKDNKYEYAAGAAGIKYEVNSSYTVGYQLIWLINVNAMMFLLIFSLFNFVAIFLIIKRRIKADGSEIGMMKSLGYRSKDFSIIYIFYPLLIIVSSLLIGTVIAYFIRNALIFPMLSSFAVVTWTKTSFTIFNVLFVVIIPLLIICSMIRSSTNRLVKKPTLELINDVEIVKPNKLVILSNKVTQKAKFRTGYFFQNIFRSFTNSIAFIFIIFGITTFTLFLTSTNNVSDKYLRQANQLASFETWTRYDNYYNIVDFFEIPNGSSPSSYEPDEDVTYTFGYPYDFDQNQIDVNTIMADMSNGYYYDVCDAGGNYLNGNVDIFGDSREIDEFDGGVHNPDLNPGLEDYMAQTKTTEKYVVPISVIQMLFNDFGITGTSQCSKKGWDEFLLDADWANMLISQLNILYQSLLSQDTVQWEQTHGESGIGTQYVLINKIAFDKSSEYLIYTNYPGLFYRTNKFDNPISKGEDKELLDEQIAFVNSSTLKKISTIENETIDGLVSQTLQFWKECYADLNSNNLTNISEFEDTDFELKIKSESCFTIPVIVDNTTANLYGLEKDDNIYYKMGQSRTGENDKHLNSSLFFDFIITNGVVSTTGNVIPIKLQITDIYDSVIPYGFIAINDQFNIYPSIDWDSIVNSANPNLGNTSSLPIVSNNSSLFYNPNYYNQKYSLDKSNSIDTEMLTLTTKSVDGSYPINADGEIITNNEVLIDYGEKECSQYDYLYSIGGCSNSGQIQNKRSSSYLTQITFNEQSFANWDLYEAELRNSLSGIEYSVTFASLLVILLTILFTVIIAFEIVKSIWADANLLKALGYSKTKIVNMLVLPYIGVFSFSLVFATLLSFAFLSWFGNVLTIAKGVAIPLAPSILSIIFATLIVITIFSILYMTAWFFVGKMNPTKGINEAK